jgi:hypothetical protein
MQVTTIRLKSQKYMLLLSLWHNLSIQHMSEEAFVLQIVAMSTNNVNLRGENATKNNTGLLF